MEEDLERVLARHQEFMRWCEPCSWYKRKIPRYGVRGTDSMPVCEWHSTHSCGQPSPIED